MSLAAAEHAVISNDLIHRLRAALLRLPGIDAFATRTALLTGIAGALALNRADNAFVDLTNSITQLNNLGRLDNGERPVVILVRTAAAMSPGSELGRQLEKLAEETEAAYGGEHVLAELPIEPEALLFGGDGEWVSAHFLEQARRVGASVARLRVPRVERGEQRQAVGGLGTGWLLAPRLLLTNHHVIDARRSDEPAAAGPDFAAQARAAAIWFDYYLEGGEKREVKVQQVLSSSVELDYALLELADDATLNGRAHLAVPQRAPRLGKGTRLNVVQCPGGGPLRYAIRNNFFVGTGRHAFQIRYLTDTHQGSSGAPVLDDHWQVVALHHGATRVPPEQYPADRGLDAIVKYHNQGIAIHTIIADLPLREQTLIGQVHGWNPA